jgi:hypothetical protein
VLHPFGLYQRASFQNAVIRSVNNNISIPTVTVHRLPYFSGIHEVTCSNLGRKL